MARPRGEAWALLAVAAAVLALAAPFLSQPWGVDEPLFLACARHILQDPWHPYAFAFNWFGHAQPMSEIATNPPLFPYLLAGLWRLSGGREWALRLALLPLDLVAGWALYGLASRCVRRPLWPTLAVLAVPAYAIDMSHVMAEKLLAALAFPALYLCARAVDSRDDRRFWASAGLFAAALLAKVSGAFLLAPAVTYAVRKGVPRRKVAGFVLLAGLPLGLYLALGGGLAAVLHGYSQTMQAGYSAPLGRLRAILAFAGGCALAPAVWRLAAGRPRPRALAAAAATAAALFFSASGVSWLARATGAVFCAAALGALGGALAGEDAFLMDWALSAFLLLAAYGMVAERTALFLAAPLTFAAARELEARRGPERLAALYVPCVAGLAALTLALAAVDYRYARAQKALAGRVAEAYAGRSIWCASHWGLQYYLVEAGARPLDWSRGGWDEAKRGDVVVLSRVNSNVLWPEKKIMAEMQNIVVGSPIPLRLISGWGGQAGFYSNKDGFLPFALSREPLDEFLVARIAQPPSWPPARQNGSVVAGRRRKIIE